MKTVLVVLFTNAPVRRTTRLCGVYIPRSLVLAQDKRASVRRITRLSDFCVAHIHVLIKSVQCAQCVLLLSSSERGTRLEYSYTYCSNPKDDHSREIVATQQARHSVGNTSRGSGLAPHNSCCNSNRSGSEQLWQAAFYRTCGTDRGGLGLPSVR